MQVDFPYHFDGRERTAEADEVKHLRNLMEQVLFTSAGERVNRPEFGAGVNQLVFAPLSDEVAATAEFMIRGALQQQLGQRIAIEDVRSSVGDGVLSITVVFRVLRTGEAASAEFSVGAGP